MKNFCKKVLIAKEDKEQLYLTPDFYMRFIDESEEDKRAFDLIIKYDEKTHEKLLKDEQYIDYLNKEIRCITIIFRLG